MASDGTSIAASLVAAAVEATVRAGAPWRTVAAAAAAAVAAAFGGLTACGITAGCAAGKLPDEFADVPTNRMARRRIARARARRGAEDTRLAAAAAGTAA